MPRHWYRALQAVLLLALFLLLGYKVTANQLTWYIHPRFVTLTLVGIIFLVILAGRLWMEVRQAQKHNDHDHDHGPASINLLIMLIPLLIGVLIPARPLGSDAVSTKGLAAASPLISSQSVSRQLETESEQRDILDWVTLFYYGEDLNPILGEQASVTGFVYFDEELPKGQFFVARIIISCCAADGFPVVMIVDWPAADTLEQDSWVRVTGPVDKVTFKGQVTPLIRAETVESVPQPEQPYLLP